MSMNFDADSLYFVEAIEDCALWGFMAADDNLTHFAQSMKERYPVTGPVPLKGSFVVRSEVFQAYQRWLINEILFVVEQTKNIETRLVNPFSANCQSNFDPKVQSRRFLIGGTIERIAGWFVAQHYTNDKCKRMSNSFVVPEDVSVVQIAAQVADESKNIIVVFCDSRYQKILENWLVALDQLGDLPVLVVALDEPLAKQLRQEGVPAIHVPCDVDFADIWAVRARVISDLVAAGYNVIHSDADAVWLKDPRPLLASFDADIISLKAPCSLPLAWRNGGMSCATDLFNSGRPKLPSGSQRNSEMAAGPKTFSDHITLNERLLQKIQWEVQAPYQVPFRGREFTCSPLPIIGETEAIRVVVLPHCQFQRFPNSLEETEEMYVCHPLSPKTAEGTEEVLREVDCWFMLDMGPDGELVAVD